MSRDLKKLCYPAFVKISTFLLAAKTAKLDVLVTCVDRTHDEQAALYAQGRTTPGDIKTNAKPGFSMHEYFCAIDAVPLVHGKPLWQVFDKNRIMLPEWKQLGSIAVDNGIDWSGNWKYFREYGHFQYTGGLSIEDLRAGKEIQLI